MSLKILAIFLCVNYFFVATTFVNSNITKNFILILLKLLVTFCINPEGNNVKFIHKLCVNIHATDILKNRVRVPSNLMRLSRRMATLKMCSMWNKQIASSTTFYVQHTEQIFSPSLFSVSRSLSLLALPTDCMYWKSVQKYIIKIFSVMSFN